MHYRIGINAGVMLPPGGCTVIRGDKCSIKYVDATDHSIKCQGDILGWKEHTLVS